MQNLRSTRALRWPGFLRRWFRRARLTTLVAAASFVSGCTITLTTSTPIAPSQPITDPVTGGTSQWETLAPGLERRVYVPNDQNRLLQLVALRIDPTLYSFRVHYLPGDARSIERWRDTLPGVVAFINGNFFDPQNQALGLVVADSITYGQAYTDRGGIFQVQNGLPRIRASALEPYLGEALEQAVQAFPMLVTNGQPAYANRADSDVSRRTVIAQDVNGRVIMIVTPLVGISLPELSAYLPTTDLALVNALNLDGGGSTLMYIATGSSGYYVRSFDPVPTVLAVYPR
jgi:hypothetical protein